MSLNIDNDGITYAIFNPELEQTIGSAEVVEAFRRALQTRLIEQKHPPEALAFLEDLKKIVKRLNKRFKEARMGNGTGDRLTLKNPKPDPEQGESKQGVKGDTGPQSEKGKAGPQDVKGDTGPRGKKGDTGP
ncbi:MAG: hypothetical protein NUV81_00530, partial [bacterium]|nr:hypothetical protein [bacterium]